MIYLNLDTFSGIVIAIFSLSLFVLGLFTAYFGSGKSRIAGISLFLAGLVIGLGYIFVKYSIQHEIGFITAQIIFPGLFYVGGALIGAIIGFLIFLAVIMKT